VTAAAGGQVVSGVSADARWLAAEYGGWSTVSRLTLTPDVDDDGEIYACRATNTLLDEAVSDAVTLDVRCTSPQRSITPLMPVAEPDILNARV